MFSNAHVTYPIHTFVETIFSGTSATAPAVHGDAVYYGAATSTHVQLVCIDATTGKTKWTVDIPGGGYDARYLSCVSFDKSTRNLRWFAFS